MSASTWRCWASCADSGGVKALTAFDHEALPGAGKVIPRKYTELMAVAVALITQCVPERR